MSGCLAGSTGEPSFGSMDELQRWLLATILERGRTVAPRREPTLELLGVTFRLRNPQRRCTVNAERRWSLPLAIGEFCWHVAGSHDAAFLSYYAKRWADFAEDGSTIQGSCYGYKAFSGAPSRWDRLLRLLRFDPESRRAVLVFQDPDRTFDTEAIDIACASTLQFLIRDSKLHAVCNMRSNDAIWGLPYDVFLFTMIQELLACELRLELGEYRHWTGSMHIYERHVNLSRRICAAPSEPGFEMPPMEACDELPAFLKAEAEIRTGAGDDSAYVHLNPYWRELLAVLLWFRRARHDGVPQSALPSRLSRYQRFLALVRA